MGDGIRVVVQGTSLTGVIFFMGKSSMNGGKCIFEGEFPNGTLKNIEKH